MCYPKWWAHELLKDYAMADFRAGTCRLSVVPSLQVHEKNTGNHTWQWQKFPSLEMLFPWFSDFPIQKKLQSCFGAVPILPLSQVFVPSVVHPVVTPQGIPHCQIQGACPAFVFPELQQHPRQLGRQLWLHLLHLES